LVWKDGLLYDVDGDTLYNGLACRLYENGQLHLRQRYRKGRADGHVQGWLPNRTEVYSASYTAGTLTKACDIMVERGARSVRAMVSHPILSGAAYEKIENSKITELITTDSIPLKKESAKIKVLSCASLMADAIKMIEDNASLSAKFIL
jgi:hypothetical protein